MHRVAQIVVRNHRGWLLLQERDEHAPTHSDMWGFVGGSVEAGESYRDAAIRELEEETGLSLDTELTDVATYEVPCALAGEVDEVCLFFASDDLSDADIDCHEGRQIVFIDPATIGKLELAPPTLVGIDALRAGPLA